MLLAGPEQSAARGLLAAFAWAAPDVARMTNASALMETLADLLHWHGHAAFVFKAEGNALELMVARAPPARLARCTGIDAARLLTAPRMEVNAGSWDSDAGDRAWVCSEIRVERARRYLLVIEAPEFTSSTIEVLGAFVRLAETTLERIAERDTARRTIASERLSVLGEAAAVLAHELRNPLATISNSLSLLSRSDEVDREVALAIVHEEVARLDSLVHDLLQLARPVDPSRRRVDVLQLVHATLDRARRELNGVHVVVAPLTAGESVEVTGDPALLALALENLLRNAAQAAPPRSEIRISVTREGEEVTVSVEDDGPGVAPGMNQRIFEPFFTTRPVGTGLGLSIVKRLVEAHGGWVRVGSSASGGARFELVFSRSQ